MTVTEQNQSLHPSGTAASSHHLPASLDWSSLSARIKNRTVLIPLKMKTMQNLKTPEMKKADIPRPDK